MQIGIFGLLGVIFVVAKLAGWIAWSWWLVLLPIYGGAVLLFGALVFGYIVFLLANAGSKRRRWQ